MDLKTKKQFELILLELFKMEKSRRQKLNEERRSEAAKYQSYISEKLHNYSIMENNDRNVHRSNSRISHHSDISNFQRTQRQVTKFQEPKVNKRIQIHCKSKPKKA